MERERYGGRGGSGGVGSGGGGINRYPDVSGRTRSSIPPREERAAVRRDDRPAPVRSSNEPWSDVPPELEALLRAQVASKPAPGRSAAVAPATQALHPEDAAGIETEAPAAATTGPKPRATRKTAASASGDKAAVKPRASRKAAAVSAEVAVSDGTDAGSSASDVTVKPVAKGAAKPRATRKPAAAKAAKADSTPVEAVASANGEVEAVATPKRRTTRKTATTEPA
jgi:hypothetical protein